MMIVFVLATYLIDFLSKWTFKNRRKPIIICIDGLIGAGKTTLINNCLLPLLSERGYSVTLVKEPIEEWLKCGIFTRMAQDEKRWTYHFQTKAFHDRIKEMVRLWNAHSESTDIFLLERSHFSDRIFMKDAYDRGIVDDLEYSHYSEWWGLWSGIPGVMKPDLFIYLKPSLDIVQERVCERSRKGEEGISKERQKGLEKAHDFFLGGNTANIDENHFVPVLHLQTDSNFRDDIRVQNEILDFLEPSIQKIRRHK